MKSNHIAPGFLVATPYVEDPNFAKTVVLMIEHHARGALGMIVNRPTETLVSSALDSIDNNWSGDPGAVLWYGGPVMRESCWLLHEPLALDPSEGALNVAPGLVISSSAERLREISNQPPPNLRIVRGVAGWGAAQLEDEISNGLWLSADFSIDLIFRESHEKMWREAYRRMGVDPSFLAPSSGIH